MAGRFCRAESNHSAGSSYIECLKQMQQGMDEVTTDDPSFTYTIDEVTYTFQLYTNELFSFTAATNSENLPNKTDESKVESPSLSSDSGKTGDDPTLVTNPVKFISEYKTKLKVLGVLYDKYSISVTEDTSNGNRVLTHMLNGKSTGVKLTFASDGVLLTGGLANKEEDVQTASFCMAAIMNMITPSKRQLCRSCCGNRGNVGRTYGNRRCAQEFCLSKYWAC